MTNNLALLEIDTKGSLSFTVYLKSVLCAVCFIHPILLKSTKSYLV